jgi:steroid delta-isomerase-like uncharacterized protein
VELNQQKEVTMKYSNPLTTVFLAGVLLAGLGGVQRASAGDMFQELTAAWNAHDPDKVAAMFTKDGLYEDVTLGMKSRGIDEIRQFAKSILDSVPDTKIELTSSFAADGHGYSEWIFSGTDVGIFKTNKTFAVRGSSINDISGGKFARNFDYYDLAAIMKQVGVLPTQTAQNDPPKH